MIDDFALLLSHFLLALVAWRLLSRGDLDQDTAADPVQETAATAAGPDAAPNAAGIVRLHRA